MSIDGDETTDRIRCPQCAGPVVIHRVYDEETFDAVWTFKCPGFKLRGAQFCDKGLLGKKPVTFMQVQLGVSMVEIQAMINRQHWALLRMKGQLTPTDEGDES